jgi:hypothetical protein
MKAKWYEAQELGMCCGIDTVARGIDFLSVLSNLTTSESNGTIVIVRVGYDGLPYEQTICEYIVIDTSDGLDDIHSGRDIEIDGEIHEVYKFKNHWVVTKSVADVMA